MRRLLIALAVSALILGLGATAAQAQRDPFEPAIEAGLGEPGLEAEGVQATADPGGAEVSAERLAGTGADGTPWLALAYGLTAVGLGVLVLSRISETRSR